MKAIVQNRYGGAESLDFRDIDQPVVGDDDVLVQVAAAGVDRGALHFMTGRPYLMRLGTGLRTPRVTVPGTNFAGRVAAVGRNVTRFQPGDEVYGSGRGTFAEYVATPAGKVAAKPAALSFEEAAVLPYGTFAGLQAARDQANVQTGDHVLVIGASGAVGSIALQAAKALGAEVTGVCGPRHVDEVRAMGADHVIDYTRDDFADGTRRFDVILDVFGRTSVRRLRRALNPRGRLVIVGGEGDRWTGGIQRQVGAMLLSPFVGQSLGFFVNKENAETLEAMNELVDAGRVRITVEHTYPLVDAAKAVESLESGRAAGRIAVMV